MRGPRFWVWALAALAAACGTRQTQLVVVTYADPGVLARIDRIEYVVRGPDGMSADASASLVGPGAPAQPYTLALYPAGSALGPITVTVIGVSGVTEVVRRMARTSFVEGESRILRMDLLSACVGASCPSEQSCGESGCASVEVPPSSLPPWEGTLPPPPDGGRPGVDGGGMDGAVPPVDGGGRDGGGRDGGRVDAGPMTDGGGLDAGRSDGGRDAGRPDGGLCDPRHRPLPTSGMIDLMGELSASSMRFDRPSDGSCPTTTAGSSYFYEPYVFCNPGPRRSFEFVMRGELAGFTLFDPWLVVYAGETIPVDRGMCIASNDDAGGSLQYDSRITLSIAAGEVVTVVATSFCDAYDSNCTEYPGDGRGTYRLYVSAL